MPSYAGILVRILRIDLHFAWLIYMTDFALDSFCIAELACHNFA